MKRKESSTFYRNEIGKYDWPSGQPWSCRIYFSPTIPLTEMTWVLQEVCAQDTSQIVCLTLFDPICNHGKTEYYRYVP